VQGGEVTQTFRPASCVLTAGAAGNERNDTMNTGFDLTEEDILSFDVSDEALETAAGTGKEKAGNYTLGFCTGLSACPA
jgi:hypothetical protein